MTNDADLTSKLSYLVYLNDDFEGGSTTFREYSVQGGERTKTEHIVSPVTGSALLFRHERWREGSPVLSGQKYVLRSDVFYGPDEPQGMN